MKHRCDLGLGVPVANVILDELKVEDCRRQVAFKLQGTDAEYDFHIGQIHRDVDVERFL